MKITTERGVLFTTASGKSILRWNGGKPPTDDGFNKLQVFIDTAQCWTLSRRAALMKARSAPY